MSETKALVTRSMSDTLTVAEHLARSGFFRDALEISQAVAKVLAGQELGFGPVASMTGIHIIKNKVVISANILGAAIKRHPTYNYRVKVLNDQECSIIFYEHGEEVGVSTFNMNDAKAAGLTGKDNWRNYPRNMLFARALSNGARWHCPDVGAGTPVYTPDEMGASVNEDGDVIPGQYEVTASSSAQSNKQPQQPVELPPLPKVIVNEDTVKWALEYKSAKGTPFYRCADSLEACKEIWQKVIDNRDKVEDGDFLSAAVTLLHEDAGAWLEDIYNDLTNPQAPVITGDDSEDELEY